MDLPLGRRPDTPRVEPGLHDANGKMAITPNRRKIAKASIPRREMSFTSEVILEFCPQVISMPQPFPRRVDRVLNPLHVATFAGEDVDSPIRLQHLIDLIF